jgi:CHAT domain-containing protein
MMSHKQREEGVHSIERTCTAKRVIQTVTRLLQMAGVVVTIATWSLTGLRAAEMPSHPSIDDLIAKGIEQRRDHRYRESIQTLEKALALARADKSVEAETQALAFLSLTYIETHDFNKVLALRLQSLAIVRRHPEVFTNQIRDGESEALSRVSGAYALLEDLPSAIKYARAALDSALRHPMQMGEVGMGQYRQQLGTLLFLHGEFREAEHILRMAYADFEIRVHRLLEAFGGVASVDMYQNELSTLRWLQRTLVAQGRTDEALEIAERSRSRYLATLTALQFETQTPSPALQSPTIEEIKATARVRNMTIVEYTVVYEHDPDLPLEFSNFVDVRAAAILVWVIKPDGSISFRQVELKGFKDPLDKLIADARASVGARGRGANPGIAVKQADRHGGALLYPSLRSLDRILIQPISDQLPVHSESVVMFVPQDALFLVPFAALQDESGKFLIERLTPVVGTSVATLALSAERGRQRLADGTGVLVVGNPAMPSLPAKQGRPPVRLPALPDAENEAREVAKIFSAKPLIGSNATKDNVLARMPSARILHFATHGLLDRDSGQYLSALVLAPSGNDSGFLQAREIGKMKLNAELAVLSACDTAEGKLTGDGVLGLSSAFMGAGVTSLVVALWAIPDTPTATLMSEFYRRLIRTGDKAQALRQAMLRTMKDYPDPGNWAAFELIGESSGSEGLLTVKGDSPALPRSPNRIDSANLGGLFVLPDGIWNYLELPNKEFRTSPSVTFNSTMSIGELMKFYRDAYLARGLKEIEALTRLEGRGGQLVFGGAWEDRELVIQVTDMSDLRGERVVSLRFERRRVR